MHILLTGAAGTLGSQTLLHILEEGHTVLAVDKVEVPPALSQKLAERYTAFELSEKLHWEVVDVTSGESVRALFNTGSEDDGRDEVDADAKALSPLQPERTRERTIQGVIHLAAIASPGIVDPLATHNINVSSSYNVLHTACASGVKRVVQASSVNAIGLAFTPDERAKFDRFPLDEREGYRPEDEYSVSKQICEVQAASLVHRFPSTRIASLRFHHILPSLDEAITFARHGELWAWSELTACARACLLALTSDISWAEQRKMHREVRDAREREVEEDREQDGEWEWEGEGHEAFFIVAPDLVWEGGVSPESKSKVQLTAEGARQVSALDLIDHTFKDKVGVVDRSWWADNPRRGLYDCSKAERLLGWKHNL